MDARSTDTDHAHMAAWDAASLLGRSQANHTLHLLLEEAVRIIDALTPLSVVLLHLPGGSVANHGGSSLRLLLLGDRGHKGDAPQ